MKKTIGIILICLLAAGLLLSLAACVRRPGEEKQKEQFDPNTDFNNNYAGTVVCDIVETDEAFFLRHKDHGYLLYYDKASG